MIYHLKTCCGLDISHYKPNNLTNWYTSPTCWGAYDRSVRTWSYVHLGPGAQFLTCKVSWANDMMISPSRKTAGKTNHGEKWLYHQQHKKKEKNNLESFLGVMWPHDINPPLLKRCHWLEIPPSMLVSQTTRTRCWCLWTTWSSRHKLLGKGQGWYRIKNDQKCFIPEIWFFNFQCLKNFLKNYWCSIFHSHLTEENELPIPNIPNVHFFSNCTAEVVSLQMKMAIPSSRPLHLRLEFVLFVWKTGFSAAWIMIVPLHGTSKEILDGMSNRFW